MFGFTLYSNDAFASFVERTPGRDGRSRGGPWPAEHGPGHWWGREFAGSGGRYVVSFLSLELNYMRAIGPAGETQVVTIKIQNFLER